MLNASISLSEKLTAHPELQFNSYRNLLAFYTYTDIGKASEFVEVLVNNPDINKHSKKLFIWSAGVLLIINLAHTPT